MGKRLTAKGVKPICPYHHKYESTYLFGAFSPVTGNAFMLDLPFCNAATFQLFLNEFAMEQPSELKIMFLDNGAFHKANKLKIPDNIVLVFLPPYSPELNPAEKVWWVLKREINLQVFKTMNELQMYLDKVIKKAITEENIIQLISYQYYIESFQTVVVA